VRNARQLCAPDGVNAWSMTKPDRTNGSSAEESTTSSSLSTPVGRVTTTNEALLRIQAELWEIGKRRQMNRWLCENACQARAQLSEASGTGIIPQPGWTPCNEWIQRKKAVEPKNSVLNRSEIERSGGFTPRPLVAFGPPPVVIRISA